MRRRALISSGLRSSFSPRSDRAQFGVDDRRDMAGVFFLLLAGGRRWDVTIHPFGRLPLVAGRRAGSCSPPRLASWCAVCGRCPAGAPTWPYRRPPSSGQRARTPPRAPRGRRRRSSSCHASHLRCPSTAPREAHILPRAPSQRRQRTGCRALRCKPAPHDNRGG